MKILCWVYAVMSVVTFVTYAIDKFKAQRGMWRIPEKTLHILELCCGWPGAIMAHKLLRHKSQKSSFRRIFWLMTVLNILVVGALLAKPLWPCCFGDK